MKKLLAIFALAVCWAVAAPAFDSAYASGVRIDPDGAP
jgi:hypothetical protein